MHVTTPTMCHTQEAVKREVEEEAGLKFEPEAVIAVECMSHSWIRVTLSGTCACVTCCMYMYMCDVVACTRVTCRMYMCDMSHTSHM